MKSGSRALVFFVCAGMELTFLYACTAFVTTALFRQTFPFIESVISFLLAALLMLAAAGRGWRVIYVLSLQSLGFVPMLWRMSDIFNSWSSLYLKQSLVTEFFDKPADAIQYFVIVQMIGWMLVFWVSGAEFARRPRDFETICARFDRGLYVFFVLFLARFYLQAALGIEVDESLSGFFVFPFVIFGLLAIGLVRNTGAARRDFLPGYQTLGVLLGFVFVVLLAGAGLMFFFLPYLTMLAEKGNDVLAVVSQPFIAIGGAILVWLFGTDFTSNASPANLETSHVEAVQWTFPWWVETLGQILAWGVMLLVALVLLAMLAGFMYAIIVRLFSRTPVSDARPSLRELFTSVFVSLSALVLFWGGLIVRLDKGRAAPLYAALRMWGRNSGFPNLASETPAEYGARLGARFPVLSREIETILGAFHREVYGDARLSDEQLARACSAWRELARPAFWALRLKSRLRRPSYS